MSFTYSQTLSLFQSAILAYETLQSIDTEKATAFADSFGVYTHPTSAGCYDIKRFYPHTFFATITNPAKIAGMV